MFLAARGEVVAELGPEFPLGAGEVRAWPLLPTADFEKVRGVIPKFAELVHSHPAAPLPAAIREIPDMTERARAIQSWLRASPDAQRLVSLFAELQSEALAITDDDGKPLDTRGLTIIEMPSDDVPVPDDMVSEFADRGFGASGLPFFLVTAVLPAQAAR